MSAVGVAFRLRPGSTPQSIPSTGFAGLDQYRASRIAVFTDDFGQLARYRDANAGLKAPAAGENRVVFFGDSITDIWKLEDYFPGKPYLNRGIGGQTTPQMMVRFREDVIDLQPKVVVILAGTNDIAGNTGPMSTRNYRGQPQFAGGTGARSQNSGCFFFCSSGAQLHSEVPGFFRPAIAGENSGAQPMAEGLLRSQFPDLSRLLHRAMVDDKGLLKRELADDGLHPNAAGYKVMAPLAQARDRGSAFQHAISLSLRPVYRIYNDSEFPTAFAFGDIHGGGGEEWFFLRDEEVAARPSSEGAEGNVCASRPSQGGHWKGNGPPGSLRPSVVLFSKRVAVRSSTFR